MNGMAHTVSVDSPCRKQNIFGHIWTYMDTYGHIWTYMDIFGHVDIWAGTENPFCIRFEMVNWRFHRLFHLRS